MRNASYGTSGAELVDRLAHLEEDLNDHLRIATGNRYGLYHRLGEEPNLFMRPCQYHVEELHDIVRLRKTKRSPSSPLPENRGDRGGLLQVEVCQVPCHVPRAVRKPVELFAGDRLCKNR